MVRYLQQAWSDRASPGGERDLVQITDVVQVDGKSRTDTRCPAAYQQGYNTRLALPCQERIGQPSSFPEKDVYIFLHPF